MTKATSLHEAKADLWYCYPGGVSTFSHCGCGRAPARGGRMCAKCAKCAEEQLALFCDRHLADKYHRAIRALRQIESDMDQPALARYYDEKDSRGAYTGD